MRIKDDEKREALFEATVKLVNEIGFVSSSVSKIAKEANVSPATLYIYYKNKITIMKRISIFISLMAISVCINAQSITDTDLFDFWVGKWDATWDEGDGKTGKGSIEVMYHMLNGQPQTTFR